MRPSIQLVLAMAVDQQLMLEALFTSSGSSQRPWKWFRRNTRSRYGMFSELKQRLMFSQVAAANLRFGDGVTAEVGMDLKNMKARKVRLLATKLRARV